MPNETYSSGGDSHRLTDREREILRLVVRSFVSSADPVGSRYLSKHFALGLSPASIRNTLSDLEDFGYLEHPYTSAGRVPTALGYRKFVNELMEAVCLSSEEKQLIRGEIERLVGDTDTLARETSRVLGRLSNLLGVALTPKLSTGVLESLDVVQLSSVRVMFVITMRGGMVRTIIAETDAGLSREDLDRVLPTLNEKLAGLTLEEIRKTYRPRLQQVGTDETSDVVRLVVDGAPALFSEQSDGTRVRFAGAPNMLLHPEFQDLSDLRNLMAMIEDEQMVVQLLEDPPTSVDDATGRAVISIGRENRDEKAEKYSVVSARYRLGGNVGTIGILGPMRMDYARAIALVEGMAALLGDAGGKPQD